MRAISIAYHDVVESEQDMESSVRACPGHYTLVRSQFRRHLEAIRQRTGQVAVSTVSHFQDWRPRIPVFLTFDDGALGSYTCVADELERLNWRGHFFITSDWIGRSGFCTSGQIRELHQRGHVIGSHTRSHPSRMSKLTWTQLNSEWSDSCAKLSDIVGSRVVVASVADGYYLRRVARAAMASGIEVLFNSEPTRVTSVVEKCLVLGRYSVQAGTVPTVSGALAEGRFPPRWKQAVLWNAKKLAKNLGGEYYLKMRRFLLSHGAAKLDF